MDDVPAVSSDPGSMYLRGLQAELEAARDAEAAWSASLDRLEKGVAKWALADLSPVGKLNHEAYAKDAERVKARLEAASDRVNACLDEIQAQQADNRADYEARAAEGLAWREAFRAESLVARRSKKGSV